MPRFAVGGPNPTEIHFQDVGAGQPVVLIHGWPLSHRMWESQVNALVADGFRCIAYDRRGFGESGQPIGGYDYDTLADDLHALMTHLDLHEAVLVGFSMGGGEVVRYMRKYGPGRIARVALLGAVTPFLLKMADNTEGVDRKVFDTMLAAVRSDRIRFLERFFIDFYNYAPGNVLVAHDLIAYSKSIAWMASPLATQQCITAFGTTDFRADLDAVTVPALIVHGDSDRIVPLAVSAARTHSMLNGSRLAVLRGAPHGFVATHSEELNALLLDFLLRPTHPKAVVPKE